MTHNNTMAATKVADQLISRLFDHRQFTSGEIRYLIEEFEEQCALDGTLDRALKQQEDVGIISDLTETNLCKLDDKHATDLNNHLSGLLESGDSLLKMETNEEQKRNKLLESFRMERKNIMETSAAKTLNKNNEIDEAFLKKEQELEQRYLKFEERINDTTQL